MSTARTLVATCAGWGVYVTWSWFLNAPLTSAPTSAIVERPATPPPVAEISSPMILPPAAPPSQIVLASYTSTPAAAQLAGIVEAVESSGSKTIAEATDRLSRVEWLAVKIRQRQPATDPRWLAEGTLQRGPNGCTRLVMSYRSGDKETHSSEMICDGRVLAQVVHHPGTGPEINGWELPKDADDREEMLNKYGCGGPIALLRHLASRNASWSIGHVRQGDRLFVQTTAALTNETLDPGGRALPPRCKAVRLTFDTGTLWLERVEWFSGSPEAGGQLLWEQAYLEPRIGEPLSLEECGRVFSYQPK